MRRLRRRRVRGRCSSAALPELRSLRPGPCSGRRHVGHSAGPGPRKISERKTEPAHAVRAGPEQATGRDVLRQTRRRTDCDRRRVQATTRARNTGIAAPGRLVAELRVAAVAELLETAAIGAALLQDRPRAAQLVDRTGGGRSTTCQITGGCARALLLEHEAAAIGTAHLQLRALATPLAGSARRRQAAACDTAQRRTRTLLLQPETRTVLGANLQLQALTAALPDFTSRRCTSARGRVTQSRASAVGQTPAASAFCVAHLKLRSAAAQRSGQTGQGNARAAGSITALGGSTAGDQLARAPLGITRQQLIAAACKPRGRAARTLRTRRRRCLGNRRR